MRLGFYEMMRRMVTFRRMRTLLVPPILGLAFLILWSASVRLPVSILEDPLLCLSCGAHHPPFWSRQALNLQQEDSFLEPKLREDEQVQGFVDFRPKVGALDDNMQQNVSEVEDFDEHLQRNASFLESETWNEEKVQESDHLQRNASESDPRINASALPQLFVRGFLERNASIWEIEQREDKQVQESAIVQPKSGFFDDNPQRNASILKMEQRDEEQVGSWEPQDHEEVQESDTLESEVTASAGSSDGDIGEAFQTLKNSSLGSSDPETDLTREIAIKEVQRLMSFMRQQVPHHLQKPKNSSLEECGKRRVFVYDLPSKFNSDLLDQCESLLPWMSMCEFIQNSGMGNPVSDSSGFLLTPKNSWFKTHQYALETIFHARILEYPCRVYDPARADVYYVPYYAGLDVLRWNFVQNVSNERRDRLAGELLTWLAGKPSWTNSDKRDHLIALGKISWDFRRMSSEAAWGNNFLAQSEMYNVTKLLIERHPWHPNDVGVPHPTFFHPSSDVDIVTWQEQVLRQETRPSLVSFAGQPRPGQTESIRGELIRQCMALPEECRFLNCADGACFGPEATLGLFVTSDFCMQPPGDSPTRRSVFDSLLAACIPVFFDPFTAYYQYPWHLPADRDAYSVYVPAESVKPDGVNVVEKLKNISMEKRREMRKYIVESILPGITYAQPGSRLVKFDDAFDIAIRNAIARAASKEIYYSKELIT